MNVSIPVGRESLPYEFFIQRITTFGLAALALTPETYMFAIAAALFIWGYYIASRTIPWYGPLITIKQVGVCMAPAFAAIHFWGGATTPWWMDSLGMFGISLIIHTINMVIAGYFLGWLKLHYDD